MGEIKISTFIIAVLLASFGVTVMAMYMADLSTVYGATYDNSTYETYNKLEQIANITEEIQDETMAISEQTGILDVIGSYFSDAYQALKLSATSFDTFETMTNSAFKDMKLGPAGELLRVTLVAIVLILIFVGVILSAIVKKNL